MQAGWYADPSDGLSERFWDGSAWTDRKRPRPPAVPEGVVRRRRGMNLLMGGVVCLVLFGGWNTAMLNTTYADGSHGAANPIGVLGAIAGVVLIVVGLSMRRRRG